MSSDTDNAQPSSEEQLPRLTFDERKAKAAKDLRDVATLIEERAQKVEAGDIAVMDHFLTVELDRWRWDLILRHVCREDRA